MYVAKLFKAAYNRIPTIDKAKQSFHCTRISPYNPDISSEDDFAPAMVSNTSGIGLERYEQVDLSTHSKVRNEPVSDSILPGKNSNESERENKLRSGIVIQKTSSLFQNVA